ncbi:MAG: hypothetical protein MI741_21840, partial [Rhodospirillales bacterium]|nr:hypothetical protein [Rhodospirillales bacterium]
IQRRALKDDSLAGMIATYPTGNSYIHPGEKLPVAEYAAHWALAKVYGAPIVHRGNQYTHFKVRDDKLYLFFDSDPVVYERWKHIENNAYWQVLPMPREGNGAPLMGFTIAGEDQHWYPADARHTRLDGEPCIELSSDLVDAPVAARYGWAQWPTGNMVGRERLPIPTFRTDDWPLPVGLSYSPEVAQRSKQKLEEDQANARKQALDRKIRQRMVDLPELEQELYLRSGEGNSKGLIQSKINRMQAVLDEFESDRWLSNHIQETELAEQLETTRKVIKELKKKVEAME